MSLPFLLRVGMSLIVLAFTLATFALVKGNKDALGLTFWLTSPHLLALLVGLVAMDELKLWTAAVATVLFSIAGVIVLPSGGASALFLPVWELLLLGLVFFALSLISHRGR